jgi:hypothetical protein
MGFGNCNNQVMDGCEVNTKGDPNNCGVCGMKCTFANAVGACVGGNCIIGQCNNGFSDCDGNQANGCEAPTATDVNNCGGCGIKCGAVPNATVGCAASKCVITACSNGTKDCDGIEANGCEVTVATDINNCGGCGTKCMPGANVAAVGCAASACTIASCNPGFGNCDNNVPNGCETNLTNNFSNCGMCAKSCANTQTCVNSVCTNGLDFGPVHTFVGVNSSFYISTGQGGCSVNQNMDTDAQYFCLHFYGQRLGMNCTPKPGYVVTTMNGNKMHKNGGCTSNGTDIPGTTCDPNITTACKMWINDPEVDSGLTNLICHCQ